LSKIIRHSRSATRVFIGDKHHDFQKEAEAELKLGTLLPVVSVMTDADGAKLIPIQEVFKIEESLASEKRVSFQKGHDQGYKEGLAEGLKQAEAVLQQLEQAIRDAVNQRQTLLDEARQKILQLVMRISRKVTFGAVAADPEKTLGIIDGVIDTLVDRSKLKIKVNREHLPIIEQNIDKFLKGSAAIKEITIEPDPRVQYGGCLIETPTGDIDARLESQFEVIEEAMLDDGKQQ